MFSLPLTFPSSISFSSLSALHHLPGLTPSRSMPLCGPKSNRLPIKCCYRIWIPNTASVARVLASFKIFFVTTATIILTVTRLKNGWWLAWKWSRARQHNSWRSHWWTSGSIRLQAASICSCTPFITWSSIFPFSVPIPRPTADRIFSKKKKKTQQSKLLALRLHHHII